MTRTVRTERERERGTHSKGRAHTHADAQHGRTRHRRGSPGPCVHCVSLCLRLSQISDGPAPTVVDSPYCVVLVVCWAGAGGVWRHRDAADVRGGAGRCADDKVALPRGRGVSGLPQRRRQVAPAPRRTAWQHQRPHGVCQPKNGWAAWHKCAMAWYGGSMAWRVADSEMRGRRLAHVCMSVCLSVCLSTPHADSGHVSCQTLLQLGASPHVRDKNSLTPLADACSAGTC
jgi:hypothetical protein